MKSGETITLTSPYGGPIQIDFGINDQPVSFTFEQVGEHPFWDDTSDNAVFSAKLAAGEYDWAEFVTPAFEIHSTLEKMRESVSNTRWGGTLEGFAAATMRYIHNFPHVLAGFKGPNIDVVPEIHDFATANGFTIENLDLVKHMNADQATCGAGCSGNPYDAYWAFDPIGHGDIHEMGHGLEKSRFRLEGWNYHASTNPYSYYSKTQYYKTTEGDPDCQSLPFKDAFVALQASVGRANPAAYLKTNYWDAVEDNWSRAASMTIQMMMTAEHQGALQDGWHLLARLHILEREFDRAINSSEAIWDAKKASLGFANYSKKEILGEKDATGKVIIPPISNNDWMVIAVSKVTGMDYRDYFSMWGQAFSAKANDQVVAFNHSAAERRFFVTSPNGYCKGEGFDGNNLPVTGSQVWPLAGAQPRLMGDSFR
ncbi:ImpA family metalloprotease [Thiothrix subterranea]|uniref:ImpA family metalloprotease n=1 Tax=Thiothrix subterranea TaxID=2735563 RepID=UPI001D194D34|nr:ImpA family metalloprotease [Thiothrix subterranea]